MNAEGVRQILPATALIHIVGHMLHGTDDHTLGLCLESGLWQRNN
jgi:hypothetical protein